MKRIFTHINEYRRWYFLGALCLVAFLLIWALFREDRSGLTFSTLDIGQGDALFIESPTGVQVVVDGGPGSAIMREISKVVPWYDKHIDLLIITNPDRDHYEGFFVLLNTYTVDAIIEPGTVPNTPEYETLENEIKSKGIPKIIARRGQIVDIGGGAHIDIFFPDRDASGMSTNDGSIVAKLVYGETSIMLQGDSTANIEHYLASLDPGALKADILKAGHHGSRTSSSAEYVKAVEPEYAVISAGKNSEYGHPHKEVLDILVAEKVEPLATCSMGRIVFISDGLKWTLKNTFVPVKAGCK